MKSALINSFWIGGLAVIAAGVITFLGLAHLVEFFFERMAIRKLVKEGRCISWEQAAERCRAKAGFLVIERRRMPRKVWFIPGEDVRVLRPASLIKSERGLVVTSPPRLDDRLVTSGEFRQRIVEINFDGILYLI